MHRSFDLTPGVWNQRCTIGIPDTGGLKEMTLKTMLEKHPERVIRKAVWGMIPHTKLGRSLIKRLRVYPGNEHPHEAQNPQKMA